MDGGHSPFVHLKRMMRSSSSLREMDVLHGRRVLFGPKIRIRSKFISTMDAIQSGGIVY